MGTRANGVQTRGQTTTRKPLNIVHIQVQEGLVVPYNGREVRSSRRTDVVVVEVKLFDAAVLHPHEMLDVHAALIGDPAATKTQHSATT